MAGTKDDLKNESIEGTPELEEIHEPDAAYKPGKEEAAETAEPKLDTKEVNKELDDLKDEGDPQKRKRQRRRQYDDAPKEEPESEDEDEEKEPKGEELEAEEDEEDDNSGRGGRGGRRTRGKKVDYKKANEEVPLPEDEDEEDDEEFEDKGEDKVEED
ncbi:hypothetical protein HF325_003791 [Metschnikowia pulcherrima]|uniref:Histone H2A.Z-specific chaperone CHZ1 n=1 Tax=Metschnikowia pulcherrima TaxID=27326 RepID=A0A8H7LBB2_9ASCO|nr:hypothetical protein HF325_003791 [Metschnikowia pulcherrima]